MDITLIVSFSFKKFKGVATLACYLILACFSTCTPNLYNYKIIDKMKPNCHTSNFQDTKDVDQISTDVTFDLWRD